MDPQAVREARERLGYSIDKTGEEGDLSPNSVLRAEHGEEIRPSTARRLARALNVEVADLYPKVETPPSVEPSFDDLLEEERRYLIILLDSYTLILSKLSEGHADRIANLSKELPPSRSLTVYQWVGEFLHTCDLIEYALDETGVMEAVVPLINRAQEGGHVPDDLLQKARDFQRAWTELFVDVWTAARDWVESQRSRPEVMKFSKSERREADKRLEKATGIVYLSHWRKKKSASAWDTHAKGAG